MPDAQLGKRKACKIAMQLIAGLKHAAALHLYHVDLHSGNIMLTNQQKLKIIDLASFISWDEFLTIILSPSMTNQGMIPLQKSFSGDFRLIHKLNQFCNQNEKLAKYLERNKFNIIADNDKESILLPNFFKDYLSSVRIQMMRLFRLGKFKKAQLREIENHYNNEMNSFFTAQGNQLHTESLLLFFDQLEKTLPDLINKEIK